MSFLSKNLLCKNIYTMLSFMWSNEPFSMLKWWLYLYCIFVFSFLIYEVSYSKNMKIFRRNVEFIFAVGFQIVFCETCFCDWLIQNCILRIKFLWFRGKITKISSPIIIPHQFMITKMSALKVSEKDIANLFNPFMTEAVICSANQWTGFYMITACVMKGLIQGKYQIFSRY